MTSEINSLLDKHAEETYTTHNKDGVETLKSKATKLKKLFEQNLESFQKTLEQEPKSPAQSNLNITYLSIEPNLITANMMVRSPIIEGDIIAFAEHIAGQGSLFLCQDNFNPCGNCVDSSFFADISHTKSLFATANLIYMDNDSHIWEVEVTDTLSKILLCKIKVTNEIITLRLPRQS